MGLVVGVQYKNILALYAHLSSIKVKVGQYVSAGDEIALSGQTGAACPTPHLHLSLEILLKNTQRHGF
jgi:murein DD-endopeptidase MepM/ murein hydrolase activator NlpD